MSTKEEGEEEEWDNWTSNSVASILVDGQKINDIFSSIRKQLDYLRRKQKALEQTHREFFEAPREEAVKNDTTQEPVEEKNEGESASSGTQEEQLDDNGNHHHHDNKSQSHSAHSGPGHFLRASFASNFASKDDIAALREELDALRKQNEHHTALENRVKTMDLMMHTEFKEINKKMDKLVLQMNQINLENVEQKNKLFTLEKELKSLLDQQADRFESQLNNLEFAQLELKKDHESKLGSLKDIVSVQEIKSKQTELKVNNTMTGLRELQQFIDALPEKYFDSIQASLQELQDDKAGRIDLESKADVEQVLAKADQVYLDELKAFTAELERRVGSLTTDTDNRISNLDGKLDRRSDRIVSWCLKQLRKEMKALLANPNNLDDHNGTDIGKVQIRCLVCDQVSTQQRETDIVHSQNQGFVQTIKGFHRPARSHSPSNSPTRPLPEEPFDDRDGQQYQQHTTMHGTMAVPTLPSPRNTASPSPGLGPGGVLSQSMPLLKILSKTNPDGTTISAHPVQQTKILSYYKDLEQKYAHTFHPGTNNAPPGTPHRNALPGSKLTGNHRPTSAPIKRSSSSTSKLKPMSIGKVVLNDE